MFYQLLVREDTRLFEAIHARFDGHVDPPLVVDQCGEVVRINDFLRDQGNAHKLRVW